MNFNTLEEDLCQLLECNKKQLYTTKHYSKYVCARNLLCVFLYKNTKMTYREIANEIKISFSLVHKNINKGVYKKLNKHLYKH